MQDLDHQQIMPLVDLKTSPQLSNAATSYKHRMLLVEGFVRKYALPIYHYQPLFPFP